ncbi:hypothetical protein JCM10212_000556 [Sporobolomyces blumeae]
MAASLHRLHAPTHLLPTGPRTPSHSPHSVSPLTSLRTAHETRLVNLVVHLASLPPSYPTSVRLVRAWRLLSTCREVHFGMLWRVGAAIIDRTRSRSEDMSDDDDDRDERERERNDRKADWFKHCQQGKLDKVDKFLEYVLALVASGRSRFALDELESYLDNQPYHDSITLNSLAGQLALLIAQPGPDLATASTRARLASSSSSSSASSDDDSTQSGDARTKQRRAQSDAKRRKVEQTLRHRSLTSPDVDLIPYLRSLATYSPALFSKSKERFKRAVELERQRAVADSSEAWGRGSDLEHAGEEGPGEAARWLDMIDRAEKFDARAESPA